MSRKNHLYHHGYNEESEIIHQLRRKLVEQSSNLAAVPVDIKSLPPISNVTINQSSGSFLALPSEKNKTQTTAIPPPVGTDDQTVTRGGGSNDHVEDKRIDTWKYVIIVFAGTIFLISIVVGMFFICRKRGVTTIGPWKTGLSGQLQKAFITGANLSNSTLLQIKKPLNNTFLLK